MNDQVFTRILRTDEWPKVRQWYKETVRDSHVDGRDFEGLPVEEQVKWSQIWAKVNDPPPPAPKTEWVRFVDEPPYDANGMFAGLWRYAGGTLHYDGLAHNPHGPGEHGHRFWLRNLPRLPYPWNDDLQLVGKPGAHLPPQAWMDGLG